MSRKYEEEMQPVEQINAQKNEDVTFLNEVMGMNIDFLLGEKGAKISELEDYLEVSRGYIRRVTKESSTTSLGIEKVWKIARFFNVSIDELLNERIEEYSANHQLLKEFLQKLIKRTKEGDMYWQRKEESTHLWGIRVAPDFYEKFEMGDKYYSLDYIPYILISIIRDKTNGREGMIIAIDSGVEWEEGEGHIYELLCNTCLLDEGVLGIQINELIRLVKAGKPPVFGTLVAKTYIQEFLDNF